MKFSDINESRYFNRISWFLCLLIIVLNIADAKPSPLAATDKASVIDLNNAKVRHIENEYESIGKGTSGSLYGPDGSFDLTEKRFSHSSLAVTKAAITASLYAVEVEDLISIPFVVDKAGDYAFTLPIWVTGKAYSLGGTAILPGQAWGDGTVYFDSGIYDAQGNWVDDSIGSRWNLGAYEEGLVGMLGETAFWGLMDILTAGSSKFITITKDLASTFYEVLDTAESLKPILEWDNKAGFCTASAYLTPGEYEFRISLISDVQSNTVAAGVGGHIILTDIDVNLGEITSTTPQNTSKIIAVAGDNGSIDPNGIFRVGNGENITFRANPDTGYKVAGWFINGSLDTSSVNSNSYTLTNVQNDVWINVEFELLGSQNEILYVSSNYSSQTPGWDESYFSSIQRAINRATEGLTKKIIVLPGVYQETINFEGKELTLTSTAPDDEATVAATVIEGTKDDVAVVRFENGEGHSAVIKGFTIRNGGHGIKCNGASPVIFGNHIVNNSTENLRLVEQSGGGIWSWNSSAEIRSNLIKNNIATSDGGGIAIIGGSVDSMVISENTIVDNTAENGGGIILTSDEGDQFTINNNTISGNHTTGGRGGGVRACGSGSLYMSGNIVSYNTAKWDAGMGISHMNINLVSNNIRNNSASSATGGLSIYNCQGIIFDNKIISNSAELGVAGGLLCDSSQIKIERNQICDNECNLNGGGMLCRWKESEIEITENDISGNMSEGSGAGIAFWDCSPVIKANTITGNISKDCGGGIWAQGAGGSIIGCNISENQAKYTGGGISSFNGTVQGCLIRDNGANKGGGVGSCNGSIIDCEVSGNKVSQSGGGLNYCNGLIQKCIIKSNRAAYSGGGLSDCDGEIVNCEVFKNIADDSGGGLSFCDGKVQNCVIGNNMVANGEGAGGGIYNCSAEIVSCEIKKNQACTGGGIACEVAYVDVDLILSKCIISNNKADVGGGIYYIWRYTENPDTRQNISNCIFAGNTAGYGQIDLLTYGGAMCFYDGDPNIISCTFVGNLASHGHTLDCFANVNPKVNNCIFRDGGNEIWCANRAIPDFVEYSNIQNYQGEGTNISVDPLFIMDGYWDYNDTSATEDDIYVMGDYHLQPNSPCIDAGDPNYTYDPNIRDINGDVRIWGTRIDIGADEYAFASHCDIIKDEMIDLYDFSILANNWGSEDCTEPNWCNGSDIDKNGKIDILDLCTLANNWLSRTIGPKHCDLNLDRVINLADFNIFSQVWKFQGCKRPDWCQGGDIDRSGEVNFIDFKIMCNYWLWED